MQNKILTIAVPSYNAEKYLTETMPSILAAKYRNLIDLVIVNDGSTDMTREVAEKISKQYPEIVRVINKENGGHGSAVNTGIEYAVGKYFKVVDADDWVDTENLDLLIEYLQETDVDNVLLPYYKVFVDENSSILNIGEYNEFTKVQKRKICQADEFFSTIGQTVGMHTITIKTDILKIIKLSYLKKCFM
ncbi:glycosyltransferase family 2 protein [Gemella haemolysans]|uniref:Glycosyltransferase, group 2 family protein n=1 Tax=Gemella haemolysans ATCC 10379 TaxID=546270 RepID=C5NWJ0_9BACL|nr:glycosyltransferase family 2 protein [Gemella haemolysans]EER68525.1 glycosyltransferase, group 2 family protein [Gemella haemolysans ATCC 10379]